MRVILFTLGTIAFFAQVQALTYIAPPPVEPKACDISVEKCVEWFAKEYKVPLDKLHYIVENESGYKETALGDMDITCPRNGQPVRSRGILQISTCWYPQIPDECAFDVYCSLDKMIYLIKDTKTCKSQWTRCREYYN